MGSPSKRTSDPLSTKSHLIETGVAMGSGNISTSQTRLKSMLVPQQVLHGNNSRKRKVQADAPVPRELHEEEGMTQLSEDFQDPARGVAKTRLPPSPVAETVPLRQTPKNLELQIARARLERLKCDQREAQSKQGPSESAKQPKSSEDVQMALERAREKLRGAMQKRDRAMQRLSPVNDIITPISALSADLVIENIAATGTAETVFFPPTILGTELARLDRERDGFTAYKKGSRSLAERKLCLQKELHALKEKLEQQQNRSGRGSFFARKSYTKEQLEKKKEEAQVVMDISHWKLFVSKQEHMMKEADNRVLENRRALCDCDKEKQQTTMQLEKTKRDIQKLESSEVAVVSLISSTTDELLKMRTALNQEGL